ncbi:MAG TPA: Uma2 family endonuclease [Silvibacterium sp.]|nr:Uma2 family endonuclease [Silvibacterium sp.]
MNALLHLDSEALPHSLPWNPPLSDDDFEALCFANDWIQFERTKDGEILMHTPAGGDTGSANAEIIKQLSVWWDTHERGRVYDSNTGFFLPDGSMYSPDTAYVLPENLGPRERRGRKMAHHCPDFVIEQLPQSDRLPKAQAKMRDWIANGAALGWLIDPYKRQVTVYASGKPPLNISADSVEGSGRVAGFILDLSKVWRFYET